MPFRYIGEVADLLPPIHASHFGHLAVFPINTKKKVG